MSDRDGPVTKGKPEVSVTQLVAGGAATVTVAVISSYFGVNGTLIGAGVMSAVSTAATAIYKHYLDRGKERIVDRAPTLGYRLYHTKKSKKEADDPTAVFATAETRRMRVGDPNETRLDLPAGAATETRQDLPVLPDGAGRRRTPKWYVLAGTAAGLFLVVMGLVTAFELFTGKPLANTVQGKSGTGTTWNHNAPAPATPSPSTSGGSSETPTAPSSGPTQEQPTTQPSPSSQPRTGPTGGPTRPSTGPTGGNTGGPTTQPTAPGDNGE